MRSKYFRLLSAITIMLMAIMACNLNLPGATPTATSTTGNDIFAATDTELPTEKAAPKATEEIATEEPVTETPTLTLEPSVTPTVGAPVADVIKDVNCRTGPSGAYDLVFTFKAGDTVKIIGRDLGAGFVFVQHPNEPDLGCWVLQSSLTISGDLTPLPAFSPPPSPTLAPNFTIKYKNVDTCKGNAYVRFIIVNTGSTQFRSAYVSVTNLKTKEKVEQSIDNFGQWVGCVLAQSISPLGIGQSGFIDSEVFQKGTPKGQKMQAAFQVCSEQNLKGLCLTQSLQFTAK